MDEIQAAALLKAAGVLAGFSEHSFEGTPSFTRAFLALQRAVQAVAADG